MQKKVFFQDIAIMRPILIMSIVLGHAFTIYTRSNSWPLPLGCSDNVLLSWINPTFISFALQAFVFVSGYLFAHKSQTEYDRVSFLASKLKRIYLPSIVFSVLYVLVFTPENFKTLGVINEILSGTGHLWFLPMLFWCNIIADFLPARFRKFSVWVSFLFLIVSYASFAVPNFLRISNALHYFIYFLLGIWIYTYKENIKDYLNLNKWILPLSWSMILMLLVLNVYLHNSEYTSVYCTVLKVSVNILLGVIGSLSLFFTINKILDRYKTLRDINTRNHLWYGMYIYHQFILMYLYYHTPLPLYLGNFSPLIALPITVVLSCLLVILTLKTRPGKWMIG